MVKSNKYQMLEFYKNSFFYGFKCNNNSGEELTRVVKNITKICEVVFRLYVHNNILTI